MCKEQKVCFIKLTLTSGSGFKDPKFSGSTGSGSLALNLTGFYLMSFYDILTLDKNKIFLIFNVFRIKIKQINFKS